VAKQNFTTSLSGTVVRFSGNGRKLGYPTANIKVETDLGEGVYFGYANLDEHVNSPALIFIGEPKVIEDKTWRVEAHLLDIEDKDYYDQQLKVKILHFHRPNQFFDSSEKLVDAMKADETAARAWFKEHK